MTAPAVLSAGTNECEVISRSSPRPRPPSHDRSTLGASHAPRERACDALGEATHPHASHTGAAAENAETGCSLFSDGMHTPPRLPVIGFDVLCAPVMSYSVPQCLLYCPPESPDRVPRTAQRRARLCTVGQSGSHWGRLHTHTHPTRVRLVWSSPLGATDGCPVLAATQLTYPSRASVRYTLGSLHALISHGRG